MKYAKRNLKGAVPKMGFGGGLQGLVGGASAGAGFGLPGLAIGGGLGFLSGLFSSNAQEEAEAKAKAEQEKARLAMEKQIKEEQSRAILATYPTRGVDGATYYGAAGGKIPKRRRLNYRRGITINNYLDNNRNGVIQYGLGGKPVGGDLIKLAKDAVLVDGATHEQGGVTLNKTKTTPAVEVEDNEVIVKDKIYSDRLGFAGIAEKLAAEKGKYEAAINSSNRIERNTARRMVDRISSQLDGLFANQEASKMAKGITNVKGKSGLGGFFNYTRGLGEKPKAASLGDTAERIGGIADVVAPFIDNLTNAKLTRETPMTPKPVFNQAVPLKTTFNINPQLAAVDTATRTYANSINGNVASSNVQNALKANVFAGGVAQKNALYGQRENIETDLMNKDAMNRQGVLNSNIGKVNDYNNANLARAYTVQDRISGNVANLQDDITRTIDNRNMYNLDRNKMLLTLKTESLDNDAAGRQTLEFMLKGSNKGNRGQIKAQLINPDGSARSKAAADLWNKYHPDEPIFFK